jgi:hypothetical protein
MYLTENWRLKAQRYILTGNRTPETQEVTFPPRPVAPRVVEAYDFSDEPYTQENREAELVEAR